MILCCAAFTKKGRETTEKLLQRLPDIHPKWRAQGESLEAFTAAAFRYHLPILFTGAAGIAVRAVAPFVRDKLEDSAVLVMDEEGRFVIPVLSGHAGGANDLAAVLAAAEGAVPVITTASDVRQVFSCDVFAVRNHLAIRNRSGIRAVTEKLLETGSVTLCVQPGIRLPAEPVPDFLRMVPYPEGEEKGPQCADLLISEEAGYGGSGLLWLSPKMLYVGVGCRRGKSFEALWDFEKRILAELPEDMADLAGDNEDRDREENGKEGNRIEDRGKETGPALQGGGPRGKEAEDARVRELIRDQVAALASIDLKKDEPGLEILAQYQHLPFLTYRAEELQKVQGSFTDSAFVKRTTGVANVCERAAVLAAGEGAELLVRKQAENGMTIAVAKGKPGILTWDTTPGRPF